MGEGVFNIVITNFVTLTDYIIRVSEACSVTYVPDGMQSTAFANVLPVHAKLVTH